MRFYSCHKTDKNFKSLYGFGGRCFNIRDVCMDFEPCFKLYNLVSIRPKSMKLGQMTKLNVIFHMVGSVYRLVTIQNSPQFPVEFRNGLCLQRLQNILMLTSIKHSLLHHPSLKYCSVYLLNRTSTCTCRLPCI